MPLRFACLHGRLLARISVHPTEICRLRCQKNKCETCTNFAGSEPPLLRKVTPPRFEKALNIVLSHGCPSNRTTCTVIVIIIIIIIIYLLTAFGLSPGGSIHLHTNNTRNNTNNNRTTQITNNVEECGPCPIFASFYPGILLTAEEKVRKNHSQGKRNFSQINKNPTQSTVYILPRHPHITNPTQTHTLQNPHTHTHTHITKQYKATTVQIKTDTVQDLPK
jgi:hypothetical protein